MVSLQTKLTTTTELSERINKKNDFYMAFVWVLAYALL